MSAEENKAVVRREQEELWNHTGDLDAAEELYAAGQAEAAKQEAANFRQGFPDVISTIEDLIAEGDKVVARWRSRATHQGEYMGIAPTHRWRLSVSHASGGPCPTRRRISSDGQVSPSVHPKCQGSMLSIHQVTPASS